MRERMKEKTTLAGWKFTDRIHRTMATLATKRAKRHSVFIALPEYKSIRLVKSGKLYLVEHRAGRHDIWHRSLRSFTRQRDAERYARKRYPGEKFQTAEDAISEIMREQ